jgi:hypothetical protein
MHLELLILMVFLVTAGGLVLLWWKGRRWRRGIAILLAGIWLYQAQWYGRALWDARWVDDERSLFQQSAVLAAIRADKSQIMLRDTTNFAWSAVCQVWGEEPYSPAWTAELRRQVFGTEHVPLSHRGGSDEQLVLVYATPQGPYIMEPAWTGRLSREFQRRWMGRYYAQQLKGQGYWVLEKFHERPDNPWHGLCYRPEDVWLEISPEPDWTDNIPALVEETFKKTKRP